MNLAQLRDLPGAGTTQTAWASGHWPEAGPGADCDATIIPVVSGHLDPDLIDQLARTLLRHDPATPGRPAGQTGAPDLVGLPDQTGPPHRTGLQDQVGPPAQAGPQRQATRAAPTSRPTESSGASRNSVAGRDSRPNVGSVAGRDSRPNVGSVAGRDSGPGVSC